MLASSLKGTAIACVLCNSEDILSMLIIILQLLWLVHNFSSVASLVVCDLWFWYMIEISLLQLSFSILPVTDKISS